MSIPQLSKIPYEQCQDFGCRDVDKVSVYSKHCCGEWNETLKFKCGVEYHYSPNFSRIMLENPCEKEGVRIEVVEATLRLELQLRKGADLDEAMKRLEVPTSSYMWTTRDWVAPYNQKMRVSRVSLAKWKKRPR